MQYYRRMLLVSLSLPLLLAGFACGGGSNSKPASTPAAAATGAGAGANPPTTAAPQTAATASPAIFDMARATTTPSGLKYIDSVIGTGDAPRPNQSVVVNYTGRLASDGKVFDTTTGRGPATFALTGVIRGFSEGIQTMRPGGKRTVYIPAALAYGANPPQGSGIPANADLVFDIELVSVK